MKLIICDRCRDVVGLAPDEERACRCGASRGRYVDDWHAVTVEGPCRVIGLANRLVYGTVERSEAWLIPEPNEHIRRRGTLPEEALIEALNDTPA